ncbi:MAG: tetratricopeptide repeat protein [bacterium]
MSINEALEGALAQSDADRGAWLDANVPDAAIRDEVKRMIADAMALSIGGLPETVAMALDRELTSRGRRELRADLEGSLPDYRIGEQIGEGGMGVVFLAEQREPVRRTVALKVMKPGIDGEAVLARFDVERRALALMSHANVARAFEAGSTGSGRPYFVMEYVPGQPIDTFADERRLSIRERLELFVPVCRAVHHAHRKGVVHRDLKPSNILVHEEDGRPVPKVIDFGIAKSVADSDVESRDLTQAGQFVGTIAYMSPEQLGPGHPDAATDVYSLGVVLYELLTGALPLELTGEGMTLYAAIRKLREEEPLLPSVRLRAKSEANERVAEHRSTSCGTIARSLRGELDWVVMKALAKVPERRYGAASELAADIERFLRREPVLARPPSTSYILGKLVARHRALFVAGAALLLTVTASAVGFGLLYRRATRSEAAARMQADRSERLVEVQREILSAANPETASGPNTTVEQLLATAEPLLLGGELDDEVRVGLLATLGQTYRELGMYEKSTEHLSLALELLPSGPDHIDDRIDVVAALGTTQLESGQMELARENLESALSMDREHSGPPSRRMRLLNALGDLHRLEGRLDEARRVLDEALGLAVPPDGPERLDVARTLNNLGNVALAAGDYAQARQKYEESLVAKRQVLGATHFQVAKTLNNLSTAETKLGAHADAISHAKEAIAIMRPVVGDQHPDLGRVLNGLAGVEMEAGRLEDAELHAREAYAIAQGGPPLDVAMAASNLGSTLAQLGRLDESIPMQLEAIAANESLYGPSHPRVADCRRNYAVMLLDAGRGAEAQAVAERALRDGRDALGEEHPVVGVSMLVLGDIEAALGNHGRAIELYEDVHRIWAGKIPDQHPYWEALRTSHAKVLRELGRDGEADVVAEGG